MEQALIFKLDGCEYAVNNDLLLQIIRLPELTRIAYVSKSILGLCSIDGQIIPVLDALKLLVSDESSSSIDISDVNTRILLIKHEEFFLAFVVQEVVTSIDVIPENVEFIESEDSPIVGFMKHKDSVVQILSFDRLLQNAKMPTLESKSIHEVQKQEKVEKNIENRDEEQYLIFNMGDEKFALFIDLLREIIVNRDHITPIANTPDEVLGLITIRNEVLPVIDLRIYFKKTPLKSNKNRILIVRVGNSIVGVLVDAILDIKELNRSEIEILPEKFRDFKISGISKQNSDLISVISKDYLKTLSQTVLAYTQTQDKDSEKEPGRRRSDLFNEVAIFSLGEEEFAIDMQDVNEIIRYENFTAIPSVDDYIVGMINLRGEVLPVISLKSKLGYQNSFNDDSKILISTLDGEKLGILVDEVQEIKDVSIELIKENSSENSIFPKTILLNSGERIILTISIKNLFSLEKEEILELEEEVV